MKQLYPPRVPVDDHPGALVSRLRAGGLLSPVEPAGPGRSIARRQTSSPKTARTNPRGHEPEPTHPLWPVSKPAAREFGACLAGTKRSAEARGGARNSGGGG